MFFKCFCLNFSLVLMKLNKVKGHSGVDAMLEAAQVGDAASDRSECAVYSDAACEGKVDVLEGIMLTLIAEAPPQ